MSKTIDDYSPANSIDPINDYFLIEPSGGTIYNKINRNTILGVTGTPADLSTVQTLSNKVLDHSNSITVKASSFTLQDASDTTKQAVFSASGISTSTTRTYTLPDASTTLVGTGTTQTLTNKTLTSPAISGGTIDNATVTVDSISGHSSATVVTVANLQISNGVLNSANAVTATSIAAGAVQPQALVTGTGSGWAWQSFTPTLTNLTLGNGTLTGSYIQIGKTVFGRISFTLGSTSAVGTTPTFSLPVTAKSGYSAAESYGTAQILHTGNYINPAITVSASTTTVQVWALNASGTYATYAQITASVPFTWGAADAIYVYLQYEAA